MSVYDRVAARAEGAVVGCLVGDASAVNVHWCYDPEKLEQHILKAKEGPAFCEPPGNQTHGDIEPWIFKSSSIFERPVRRYFC